MQNYKQKYLKYKTKYLELKGGTKQNIIGKIPEFCTATKPDYVNCEQRVLNIAEYYDIADYDNTDNLAEHMSDLQKNPITKLNYDPLPDDLKLGIRNALLPVPIKGGIVYLKGFYNKELRYDKQGVEGCDGELDRCSLKTGTVINQKYLPRIIKDEFLESITLKARPFDRDRPDGEKGVDFLSKKGVGQKNLYELAQKLNREGYKYIVLHPSGGEGLVRLYSNFGFVPMQGVEFFEGIPYNPPIMYASVRTVIEKTVGDVIGITDIRIE